LEFDSGLDLDHPALQDALWTNSDEIPDNNLDDDNNGYIDDIHGWDMQSDDNNVDGNIHDHGTTVAGIMMSQHDSEITGIAPNVKYIPLRVLSITNQIYESELGTVWTDALYYAVDNGAKVIVMSFAIPLRRLDGSLLDLPANLLTAINYAYTHNVTLIASSGNNSDEVYYPARFNEVIGVTAINEDKTEAIFSDGKTSNNGLEIELSAPGINIRTTTLNGEYSTEEGTSFSAPLVAGTVALMYSVRPDISPQEIRLILARTSEDLGSNGWDTTYGHGLINTHKAVKTASDKLAPILLNSEISNTFNPSDQTKGSLNIAFTFQELSGIYDCQIFYRNVFGTIQTWQNTTICSGSNRFNTESITSEISISLAIEGSYTELYGKVTDYAGNVLEIANKSTPLLYETELENPMIKNTDTSLSTTSLASSIPTTFSMNPSDTNTSDNNQTFKIITSSYQKSKKSSTVSAGTFTFLIGILILVSLVIYQKRRGNKL
jgi:subtilisin family serine protease